MTTTTQHNAQVNTPTQRINWEIDLRDLSNKDIYNDIYSLVSAQVDEMLGPNGYYDWSKCTNYKNDILDDAPNYSWLISIVEDNEHEFKQFVNDMIGDITQDKADQMIANFSRYKSIYWKNYKKMIKHAGLTRDVYIDRCECAQPPYLEDT